MPRISFRYLFLLVPKMLLFSLSGHAQDSRPEESIKQANSTEMWNGFYGTIRLSGKLFWDAQFHYRRAGSKNTAYFGKMSKIYNRHALSYLVNEKFKVSLGPVLRLNFSPEPGNPRYEKVVLEPRIWHEYLFAMPLGRSMAYHRARIEHRWSRSNETGSEWMFRNRWRYKFYMNIPINKPRLMPGAFFFSPDVEIILQSGKPVIDSPLEDLRLNPTIGYIHSPRLKYTAGMMYTTGQTLEAGYIYTSRWVFRTSVYISLDFRKKQARVPDIRFFD